jgi:hypothetical protein
MHFVCVDWAIHKDFTVSAVPIEERDWTPQEWRARKHFSKSTHLKLKKAGLAPEEEVVVLPGFKLVRITPQARRDYERKIAELRQSKEAALESARRQAQVELAGRLAAQSPNHVSRARPIQRRRRR